MSDDTFSRATAKRLVAALCNFGGYKGEQEARMIAPELLAEIEEEDRQREADELRRQADALERHGATPRGGRLA